VEYSRNFYQIKSNEDIFEKICQERKEVGYYNLPYQNTTSIKKYTEGISQKVIVLIGIGGSSLGVKAIYQFLLPKKKFSKKLIFLDTIDPLKINLCLSNIDINGCHFVTVSKSGNTSEPISILKYISSLVDINSANFTCISNLNSPLEKFAKQQKLQFFHIDENVGGRFSIFSNAGLIPLAMIGVDVDRLLEGAKEVSDSFFNKQYYYDHIVNKARFLVENKSRFNINVIISYSSIFEGFNKWFVQIWAESLGKKNVNGTRQGLTPIALLGPDDQHSFLQLIIDGPRDKTVTFFKINDFDDDTMIPDKNSYQIFDLDFLNNRTFNSVLNYQADSTYEAILQEKDIPCDLITIPSIDEESIAKLIFRYQLLVSCIGKFLQINAYDQPGVELGKILLKDKLKNE